MHRRTTPDTTPSERRHRGWSVVSNALTRTMIRDFIELHPQLKAIGCLHSRDPGTETHGHVFFYDQRTARTASAVKRKFPVPVIVTPYVVHPGEPGPSTGKHAPARGARYLTHEHPEQQARGKARYGDDEQIATPRWNWRADVDALNAYERVDPAKPARATILRRLEDRVRSGELTARDVYRQYPDIFGARSDSRWKAIERQANEWATADLLEARELAETAQRETEQQQREYQETKQLAQAEREQQQRELEEAHDAAIQFEREQQQAQDAAGRRAAEQARSNSLSGQAEAAEDAAAQRQKDIFNYLATILDITCSPAARECAVLKAMTEDLDDSGKPFVSLEAYFLSHAMCKADEIGAELADYRRDLDLVTRRIVRAEFHAAEGDHESLEHAIRLRREWEPFPDLVRMPTPHSGLSKAQLRQLLMSQPQKGR